MGDLLQVVNAPDGLKLRPMPSTDDATSPAEFLLPNGTIVEALEASDPNSPHFVLVSIDLTQPALQHDLPFKDATRDTTNVALLADLVDILQAGNLPLLFKGYASLDYLAPQGTQPQPGPAPLPGPGPAPPAAQASSSGAGIMILLVAVVAAALYAAK